jgi:HEAT repeat protein
MREIIAIKLDHILRGNMPLFLNLKIRGLIRKLPDPSAANELEKIGAPAAGALVEALSATDDAAHPTIMDILARIGDPAIDPLAAALRHPSGSVRQAAVLTLAVIASPRAVDVLTNSLKYEPFSIRAAAVEPLLTALHHPSGKARTTAAAFLGWLRDERAIEPLLQAISDPDADVRRSAMLGLGQNASPRAVELLVQMLKTQADMLLLVIEALALSAQPAAIAALVEPLKHGEPAVRLAVIHALGNSGSEQAIPPLLGILSDKHPELRQAAVYALDRLRWEPGYDKDGAAYWVEKRDWFYCERCGKAAVGALTRALRHADPTVRHGAAYVLRDLGWSQDLSAKETVDENTARFWLAMNKWADDIPVNAPLIETLQAELRNPHIKYAITSYGMRDEIAKILARLGWAPEVQDETAIYYWIGLGDWERCFEIGAPAAPLLLDLLSDYGMIYDQRKAARILVRLYQAGKLDETTRQRLLKARPGIITHNDVTTEIQYFGNCRTGGSHTDSGLGIDFPL